MPIVEKKTLNQPAAQRNLKSGPSRNPSFSKSI